MGKTITISIPDSLKDWDVLLCDFFIGMIHKLDANSHKQTPTKESLETIMTLLVDEIIEFEAQIYKDRFDENSLIELMDQANFAFLAYVALRNEGVSHEKKGVIEPK
jgi:hypothetical protein